MNTKQQGDIGVAMAIAYFTGAGYAVSVPLTDNSKYDLLVELNGVFQSVQCKTTNYMVQQQYRVELRTKGGNTSWNGIVGRVESDLLFVYSFDGRGYLFQQPEFLNKGCLVLGPSKAQNVVFNTK